jgi:hypothetical protein
MSTFQGGHLAFRVCEGLFMFAMFGAITVQKNTRDSQQADKKP